MAFPVIVVAVPLAMGLFGGILYWGAKRAKLQNGDTAYVPSSALSIASALAVPLKIDSLAGLGGLVKVENVILDANTAIAGGVKMATGSAGKEVGVSVQLKFPVSAVQTIERNGQQFTNPEKV